MKTINEYQNMKTFYENQNKIRDNEYLEILILKLKS